MRYKKFLIPILVLILVILYNISRAKEKWNVIGVDNGLPHKFVKCITTDVDIIWIGTANGVALYDPKKGKIIKKITNKDGLLDNFITAIAIDINDVWIGTSSGINIYSKKSGKIVKSITKKSGLSDDFITDIAVSEDYIWVATKFWGVNRYDKKSRIWKNFSVIHGLADNSVNCLAIDGVLLWAGTKNGLSYYDEYTGLWMSYDVSQGLPEPNVKSIAVDGQYIWCGTSGGGLARFDKYDETFRVFTTDDGLADDFIQSIKLDGSYLWIGTFSGATKYDKLNNKWLTYTISDGLSENSVSAIEIDGNYALFGTDGGGITIYDKDIPQATISPLSYYYMPGKIVLIGTAFDYNKIKSYKIMFKTAGVQNWLTAGVKLLSSKNIKDGKLAEWDVSKLLNNIYYDVKLEVTDNEGKVNDAIMSFIVDIKPPQITLGVIPEAVKESPIFIKGTFIEDNLTRILIQPDNILADVNKMTHTYSAEVSVNKGINEITITAYDIANQNTSLKQKIIYDIDKPKITLDKYKEKTGEKEVEFSGIVEDSGLQRIVLNPGNKEVPFEMNKVGSYKFSVRVQLNSGINKFEISAYDYVGNKTTVSPVVEYTSTFPVVNIDKSLHKVNQSQFVINGKWIDDNIDYITIDPPGERAKIDKQRQTFSLNVKLKEGENVFTATIVDKDNNKSIDVLSVIYTTEKSTIQIVNKPEWTSDKELLISGKFMEPNLKKIVLQPGGKEAMIDYRNSSFSVKISDMKYGENKFKIEMFDKFEVKTEQEFSIVYDNKTPVLKLDDIPDIVNVPEVMIKGIYDDDYIDKVSMLPNYTSVNLDIKNKSFKQKYLLDEGENKISIVAYDKAGNKTEIKKMIKLVPQVTTSVEETGFVDTKYVKKLKDEIERLKALLRQKGGLEVPVKKEIYVYVPKGSAFYFVPYKPEEGFSMMDISRRYLGSPLYIDFITRVNNIVSIQTKKRVLLPTKTLIESYKNVKDEKLRNIVDIIGLSYYDSRENVKKFKERMLYYLMKKGYVYTGNIKKMSEAKSFNITGYKIVFKNSGNLKSNSNSVFISFNKSYLNISIPSGRFMSDAK